MEEGVDRCGPPRWSNDGICNAGRVAEGNKLNARALVKARREKALDAQYPLAGENVMRLRRVHPEKSPEELISYLSKIYIGAVAPCGSMTCGTPP